MSAVLELIGSPAFIYDVGDQRIVEANAATAARLGCPLEELKDRTLHQLGVLDESRLELVAELELSAGSSPGAIARHRDGFVIYVDATDQAAEGSHRWKLVTMGPQPEIESLAAQICAVVDAAGVFGVAVVGPDDSVHTSDSFSSLLRANGFGGLASLLKALPEPVAVDLRAAMAETAGPVKQRIGRVRFDESVGLPESLVEIWLTRRSGIVAIVARDITGHLQAVRAHRRLVVSTLRSRAEVRRTIAGELHDGPVQLLASISLEMGLLRRVVADEHRARLSSMERRLGESVTQLRALIRTVEPDTLSAALLRHQVQEIFQDAGLLEPETVTVDIPASIDELALGVLVDSLRTIVAAVVCTPTDLRLVTEGDAALLRLRYATGDLAGLEGWHVLDVLIQRLEYAGGTVRLSEDSVEVLLAGAAFDEGYAMSVLR